MDSYREQHNIARRSILAGMPSANINHDMSTIEAIQEGTRFNNRFKDRQGERIGILTFEKPVKRKIFPCGRQHLIWRVKCDCGNISEMDVSAFTSSSVVSCGCHKNKLARDRAIRRNWKHGYAQRGKISPEYRTWSAIKDRCTDDSNPNYGGRGISVSEEWNEFPEFITSMGTKPSNSHTIDRIDNDSGYKSNNCRWATKKQQARNRRSNKIITVNGASKCLVEWSEQTGISESCIRGRLLLGWSPEMAVLTPVRPKRK